VKVQWRYSCEMPFQTSKQTC